MTINLDVLINNFLKNIKKHFTLLGCLILFSILFSALKTKEYTASFSFYSKESGMIDGVLSTITGIDDGTNIPIKPIVQSNDLLKNLARTSLLQSNNNAPLWKILEVDKGLKSFLLKLIYDKEDLEKFYIQEAINQLNEDIIGVSVEIQTGIVSIFVIHENKELILQISQYIIDYVNKYYSNINTMQGKEKSLFIEVKINEVKKEISDLRESIQNLKQKNKNLSSPRLQREIDKLTTELLVSTEIYAQLSAQLELKKLDSIDLSKSVFLLDEPYINPMFSRPNFKINILLAFIFSIVLSISYELLRNLKNKNNILN